MFLIVGLGNPGREYRNTRHNVGFKVIEELAGRLNIAAFKEKHRSLIAEAPFGQHKVILAMPQTFMNNSGAAVRGIMEWHKVVPKHLMVIYDDVDLEVGQLRVRLGGGSSGHKGVESIIESIKTPEFGRIRIGIGRDSLSGDISDYVLSTIPSSEQDPINAAILKAAEAVEAIISSGLEEAMNRFN